MVEWSKLVFWQGEVATRSCDFSPLKESQAMRQILTLAQPKVVDQDTDEFDHLLKKYELRKTLQICA